MTAESYLPRGQERALWSENLDAAASGHGRSMTVSAPPGIGKSRLLTALASEAADAGFRILRSAGRSLDRNTSHSATLELFETVAARDVPGVYDGVAAFARPLLEGGQTSADPFAQTHALFWCLANLAVQKPLAILVDDAQWLDAASAGFLAYVVERADELPIAVAVAGRPGVFREDATIRRIRNRADATCDLEPLTDEQVRQVLEDLVPGSHASVATTVATLSGGNALLVHQIARAVANGELQHAGADPEGRGILSAHVRRRTGELSPSARSLLIAAAVGGDGEPWNLAGALAELPETDVNQAVRELAESGLILDDRSVARFPHALIVDALLEETTVADVSRLHRAAAEMLRGNRPEVAVAHLLLTEPADDPVVVDVLLRQAMIEGERGLPNTAATLLRRAAAEHVEASQAAKVDLALGQALLATGATSEAAELLARSVESAADADRFAAARSAARALAVAGDPGAGVRILERVSTQLGGNSDEARRLRADLAGLGQTDHAMASVAPEISAAASFDQRAALAMSSYDHCVVWNGRAVEQIERIESVVHEAMEQLGMDSPTTGLMVAALVVCGGSGWSTARDVLDEASIVARGQGSTVALASVCALQSRLAYLQGRLRDAQADGELGVDVASRANPLVLPAAISVLVMALAALGQTDAADDVLERHGVATGDVPPTGMAAQLLLSRVMLRRAQGRLDEAVADVERIAPFARGRGPWPSSWTPEIVRALRAAGQDDRAAQAAARHLEEAEVWGAPLHLAEALLLQAEFTPAVALIERALVLLEPMPAPLVRGQALYALGALHRREGRRTQAQQFLLQALELADAAAAAPMISEIREELAVCGLRPRRAAQSGVASLTASELRITRLAAGGLTNTGIAQELYLSVKTVENHLTRAYAKLAITSRRELADLDLSAS